MTRAPDIATLLTQPNYLLHRIDPAAQMLTFVPTRRALLAAPGFIDGRTPFATGPARVVAIDAALAVRPEFPPAPDRLIFHMGFCGSTLLTRLLDRPGAAFTYREPNALADLANWTARLADTGAADARLRPLLALTLAKLRTPWAADEACVVKPSNWANNLLPLLVDNPDLRAIYVTIAPRAFVTGIFRGGRDRMAFAGRALVHLATAAPAYAPVIAAASTGTVSPFEKVARFAALLHRLQLEMFAAPRLDFATIVADPAATARAALELPVADAARHDKVLARDAKTPDRPFAAADHARADGEVQAQYRREIDAGLAWAATQAL